MTSVSPWREGEEDGVHYHFVTREEMEGEIAEAGRCRLTPG